MIVGSKNNHECRAELLENQGVLMFELKCLCEEEMVQDEGERLSVGSMWDEIKC